MIIAMADVQMATNDGQEDLGFFFTGFNDLLELWGMRKDSPHCLVFTRFYSSPFRSLLGFTTLQLN